MNEMIAYCGLDCEKCNAYIATITDNNVLREETAKLWSELNQATITPDMINCMGCRTEGVKTPFCESMCGVRKCVNKKGFNSCAQCCSIDNCEINEFILSNNAEARDNLQKLI